MIGKSEIEWLTREFLLKVLSTKPMYHYTKFDIGINKIIINNTLQFSDPTVFNDPFDCNEKLLKIDIEGVNLDETISKISSELNIPKNLIENLKRLLKEPNNITEILKNEKQKYKLACFSEVNDETLMWSHYADKHSGVCIGFDFPHQYEEKFILCPANYIECLQPVDGEADKDRVILYWLATKSKRWDYEREIRAITHSKTQEKYELITFNPQNIKEIIFGCNVSPNKIQEAIKEIQRSKVNLKGVVFKRMYIDDSSFLLKEEIIHP